MPQQRPQAAHGDDSGHDDDGDDDRSLPPDGDLPIPSDLQQAKKLRREARNARDRAKAAEEELTGARAQLDALRRDAIGRIAETELRDARDFTDRHGDIAEFLDDNGNVDAEAVLNAARALAAERPHFARQKAGPPPSDRPVEGLRPGASPEREVKAPSWSDALRPAIG